MASRLFVSSADDSKVYAVGRVGYDIPGDDIGGPYTGVLRTGRVSPAGLGGLVHFRRIRIRVSHTGSFTMQIVVYVDGVQTQVYNSSGVLTNQTIAFTQAAPTTLGVDGAAESILVADIDAHGSYCEVVLSVASDAVTGVQYPESIEIGHRNVRPGLQRVVEVA